MYISDPDFYCGMDGTDQAKVVQEVLADLKKNVEIVLQCTFLVLIVFPAIAHFQQTCQNYPNQTKKRFISIFIFGQGKSVPSPPSIFSKKISGENIDLDSQRSERLSS